MGTYNKGILGPFSGKVGTVVGANWRGKDILRSLPKRTNRTPTQTQQLQRLRFTTVSEFLTPISALLTRYYGQSGGELTRRNRAMSYHMKEAVNYVDPDFEILYNKVQIAKGDLIGLQNATTTAAGSNTLRYDWEDNSGQGQAKPTDQLVVVAYAPTEKLYFYSLAAAPRSSTRADLILPPYFAGLEVQSWIAFVSADEKMYATSLYMGAVTIS